MVGFSMQPYGIQSMLTEGHRHLSGLDDAIIKNIDACKQLSTITRTSLGPNVLAGKAQQEEIGDGANLTVSFAGELLQNVEELIKMRLHPSEIIVGYTKAINNTIEVLEELVENGSESK